MTSAHQALIGHLRGRLGQRGQLVGLSSQHAEAPYLLNAALNECLQATDLAQQLCCLRDLLLVGVACTTGMGLRLTSPAPLCVLACPSTGAGPADCACEYSQL